MRGSARIPPRGAGAAAGLWARSVRFLSRNAGYRSQRYGPISREDTNERFPLRPRLSSHVRFVSRRARVLSGLVAVAIAVAIPTVNAAPAVAAAAKFPGAAWSKTIG